MRTADKIPRPVLPREIRGSSRRTSPKTHTKRGEKNNPDYLLPLVRKENQSWCQTNGCAVEGRGKRGKVRGMIDGVGMGEEEMGRREDGERTRGGDGTKGEEGKEGKERRRRQEHRSWASEGKNDLPRSCYGGERRGKGRGL